MDSPGGKEYKNWTIICSVAGWKKFITVFDLDYKKKFSNIDSL
jgi:hypothetical protein